MNGKKEFAFQIESNNPRDIAFQIASQTLEAYSLLGKIPILERRVDELENRISSFLTKSNVMNNALASLKDGVSKIHGLNGVYLLNDNNEFTVWFIETKDNIKIEENVYLLELDMRKKFNDLEFDFLLLPSEGQLNLPVGTQKIL